ncbi:hypothetical protein pb186bvf_003518 [Paramecium bursaria]
MIQEINQELVCCPYNKDHKMIIQRLKFHIANECTQKRLNGHLYKHCPYNYYHIIIQEEYEDHVKNCIEGTQFHPVDQLFEICQETFDLGDWGKQQNDNQCKQEITQNTKEMQLLTGQFENMVIEPPQSIWDQIWKDQGYL